MIKLEQTKTAAILLKRNQLCMIPNPLLASQCRLHSFHLLLIAGYDVGAIAVLFITSQMAYIHMSHSIAVGISPAFISGYASLEVGKTHLG